MKANDVNALMTRLKNCADQQGVSVERLLLRPDHDLLRVPNLGPKTLAVGRNAKIITALWLWL
jgi:hypothetical protein